MSPVVVVDPAVLSNVPLQVDGNMIVPTNIVPADITMTGDDHSQDRRIRHLGLHAIAISHVPEDARNARLPPVAIA
jgi:hypothetical protein